MIQKVLIGAKMGIFPFRPKQVAKYPYSETIKPYAPILNSFL